MMKKIMLMVFCAGFVGCTDRPTNSSKMAAAKLKQELFRECMTLAATNPRQGDDDVSDIIESCDDYAFWTSKQQIGI